MVQSNLLWPRLLLHLLLVLVLGRGLLLDGRLLQRVLLLLLLWENLGGKC